MPKYHILRSYYCKIIIHKHAINFKLCRITELWHFRNYSKHYWLKVWSNSDFTLLYLPRLHLFDQKYSKTSNTVKYFCNELKLNLKINVLKYLIKLWHKAEFSASLLQSSVSHDLQKSFSYDTNNNTILILPTKNFYVYKTARATGPVF